MSHPTPSAQMDLHKAQSRYSMPAGARQILLVRHGSSVGPTVDTIQLGALTISNPELTPDGHVQAQALASKIKDEPIAHIFVTPLQRTQQTAAPLVAATGIAPAILPDLREFHLGEWEHNFYDHLAAGNPLLARVFAEERWDVIPQAESAEHFAERVRRGIAAVVESTSPDTTSVVFSHAGTIAEICCQATGSRRFAFIGVENSSVSRLVISQDGRWQLRSFNDVSHLGYR